MTREPYQRLGELGSRALYGSPSVEESMAALMDIDFDQFLEFQAKFLRSVKLQWLITGHLDEERAMNLFNIAKTAIDHRVLNQDEIIYYEQQVRLPDNSVHDLSEVNPSASTNDSSNQFVNPNSAIMSIFQNGEKTYEKSAVMRVLFGCLREPCFNQLRTQEQLGYIV